MAMEEFKVSPWLYDDPKKKKIFSLAGFFGDVEKERQDVMDKLVKLGAEVLDTDHYEENCTHVITNFDKKKEGLSDKVMGAIAAGKWVLTKVIICYGEGYFVAKFRVNINPINMPSQF